MREASENVKQRDKEMESMKGGLDMKGRSGSPTSSTWISRRKKGDK